jgi:hypothetical protein
MLPLRRLRFFHTAVDGPCNGESRLFSVGDQRTADISVEDVDADHVAGLTIDC